MVAQQEVELQQASFEQRKKLVANEALNAEFAQEEVERQRLLANENFALTRAQTSLSAIEQQKQLDAIITDAVDRHSNPLKMVYCTSVTDELLLMSPSSWAVAIGFRDVLISLTEKVPSSQFLLLSIIVQAARSWKVKLSCVR